MCSEPGCGIVLAVVPLVDFPVTPITTPAELRAASVLAICYSDEEISPYLPLTRQSLLTMPAGNACWLIAGLLTTADRIAWATACAKRAHGYAAASENGAAAAAAMAVAAEYAADTTAKAAARAARAAQYAAAAMAAAHYADAAVSATSEYRRAIEHGADLLGLPA